MSLRDLYLDGFANVFTHGTEIDNAGKPGELDELQKSSNDKWSRVKSYLDDNRLLKGNIDKCEFMLPGADQAV